MDESAIFDEVLTLHGILTIDVAVDGWEGHVFTWGDLMVRRINDNRDSDVTLNHEKSAEVIVPENMSRWRYGEGPNDSQPVTKAETNISLGRQKIMLPYGKNGGNVPNGKERRAI
jgi:hypothetical protein